MHDLLFSLFRILYMFKMNPKDLESFSYLKTDVVVAIGKSFTEFFNAWDAVTAILFRKQSLITTITIYARMHILGALYALK